ncbi:MAG: glycoside hydrolase family 95 protein, partial [Duncaniella sp.]|nr:glycoside hydrolase family 95 protein [Duncaniella sp.]
LDEVYQLNEETLWSGAPGDKNNPKAKMALDAIRAAVDAGDYALARRLWKENGQGPYTARYLPLADMRIRMLTPGEPSALYRDLNLDDATATVSYELDGVRYERTSFISYPDQTLVVRLEADIPDAISFDLSLASKLRYHFESDSTDCLALVGKAPVYVANRDYDPNQIVYDDSGKEGMNLPCKVFPFIGRHSGAIFLGNEFAGGNEFADMLFNLCPGQFDFRIGFSNTAVTEKQPLAGVGAVVISVMRAAVLAMIAFQVFLPCFFVLIVAIKGIHGQTVIGAASQNPVQLITGDKETPLGVIALGGGKNQRFTL